LQDRARVVGRRDLQPQLLDTAARLGDLFGVRGRQATGSDPERVFKADADVAAEHNRLRRYRELVATRPEHPPAVVCAE
jgi:hypothetical protein